MFSRRDLGIVCCRVLALTCMMMSRMLTHYHQITIYHVSLDWDEEGMVEWWSGNHGHKTPELPKWMWSYKIKCTSNCACVHQFVNIVTLLNMKNYSFYWHFESIQICLSLFSSPPVILAWKVYIHVMVYTLTITITITTTTTTTTITIVLIRHLASNIATTCRWS